MRCCREAGTKWVQSSSTGVRILSRLWRRTHEDQEERSPFVLLLMVFCCRCCPGSHFATLATQLHCRQYSPEELYTTTATVTIKWKLEKQKETRDRCTTTTITSHTHSTTGELKRWKRRRQHEQWNSFEQSERTKGTTTTTSPPHSHTEEKKKVEQCDCCDMTALSPIQRGSLLSQYCSYHKNTTATEASTK